MKRLKNYNKLFILFIMIFCVSFLYSCFFTWFCGDEFWNYGFSYNISKGMVVYRDFNVMQTPLYFFLASIFIKIFGSHLYVMYLLNALITAFIMIYLFSLIKWKSLYLWPIIIFLTNPSYNYLCLLFLFIILYLINKKKDEDVIMGFLIGIIFLTKQSLGILLIPCLFYSKNKIKTFISFCIPFLFLSIYLIYNNAFYEFIDYSFLGLLDFNNNNKFFSIFTVIEFFVIVYLLFNLIKNRFKNKEYFYILMFQIIVYPIFEFYHFIISFIPVMYIFIKDKKSFYFNFVICFTIYFSFICYMSVNNPYINNDINSFFYMTRAIDTKYIEEENVIIGKYESKYDYNFYIMINAYFRKLYFNKDINEFDFLLNGNMGYNGDIKMIRKIDNICNKNSCVFFVEPNDFKGYTQLSKKIYYHVINNYQLVESNKYLDIYSN